MKNKNRIALTCALATVTVIAAVFFSQSNATRGLLSLTPKAQAQSGSQIPPQILYDQMFQLIISFKRKAEIQRMKSEPITAFSDYFKQQLALTEQENEVLEQTAAEFVEQAQAIDARAANSIARFREAAANGSGGSTRELTELQEERDNLALVYRDRLNELLGSRRFIQLDNFLQETFAANLQTFEVPTN